MVAVRFAKPEVVLSQP